MMHRIVLSLLSVGMVANCIHAAQDEQLPYFQFRKGVNSSQPENERFRPLFWPKWASQSMCTPEESKKAAFVQRLQELSRESRTAAKDGLFEGCTIGGIGGAVIGALAATIFGFRGIHMPGKDRPDEFKNISYYGGIVLKKFLQIAAGATTGAAIGGTIGAVIAVPKRVHNCLTRNGGYSGEYLHQDYCKDTHVYALSQLANLPGLSPELKAIVEKLSFAALLGKGALSDEESKRLDEYSIAYSDTALYEELNQEHICPLKRTLPLSEVIEELENTDKQQRERIWAISDGSYTASTFARNSLFGVVTALTAANRNETALEKIFYDVETQERREADFCRMRGIHRDTSKLIKKWKKSEDARTDELAEEISKNAFEFKQLYQDYHNLPNADTSAL